MTTLLWCIVIFAVVAALAFDVINGFHDCANSIATVVSTRVLSPRYAVWWAAGFNFLAMFVFHKAEVARTIAKIIKIDTSDHNFIYVVLAGLVGAIIWDLLTWWWGLPTSSSHALLGGLVGAGCTYKGPGVVEWKHVNEVLACIPLAPIVGLLFGFGGMLSVIWIFRKWRPSVVDRFFRKGQLLSAALYSLGHGGNDAQKTIGIIVALLIASGHLPADIQLSLTNPDTLWIILACNLAMGVGTAFGGWRIVKTMGMKITKLKPVGGFCAEMGGALTLFLATHSGIPVSTTHTITGAIVGVGATQSLSGIKWGVASRIVWAWVITIPASAAVAALSFYLLRAIFITA